MNFLNKKSSVVASFFFQKKLYLVYEKKQDSLEEERHFLFSHSFFFIPSSKLARFFPFFSFSQKEKQKFSLSSKKPFFFNLEGNLPSEAGLWQDMANLTETWRSNSKIFFVHFKNGLMREEMDPERIFLWDLKEKLIAAKQLKEAGFAHKGNPKSSAFEYQVIHLEEEHEEESQEEKDLREVLKDLDIAKSWKLPS